jgi:hypothetical protein
MQLVPGAAKTTHTFGFVGALKLSGKINYVGSFRVDKSVIRRIL